MACLNTFKSFNSQPILAECLTLWRAIKFVEELGLPKVQLEDDAQAIINVVTSKEACDLWYEGILEETKAILHQFTH